MIVQVADPSTSGVALQEALDLTVFELTSVSLPNARRDAELLLLHVTRTTRAEFIAHPDRRLSAPEAQRYRELIARRALSEPIQYITGEREFYGLRFVVTPDVLIPRPETEHLVEAALERIPPNAPYRIAEVGTG